MKALKTGVLFAAAVLALGACSDNECPVGLATCTGSCRDLQNDFANCGACGEVCASGEVCAAGQCLASCLAGQVLCGDKCIDPQNARAFCGATGDCAGANAGAVCPSGEVCAAGQCQASCLAGQLLCGDKCVDPQNDRVFCGATGDCAGASAGAVCPSGEVCAAGQCQASCLAGQVLCGDKCVDPQNDRAFCGATGDCAGANAGAVCPSGEVCAAGQCQASCLAGQSLCGDKCVDPQTDRAFCGATGDCAGANAGTVCPSGEVCAAGQCQASCLAGQLLCGDKCIDPQADRAFCGATGDCAGANAGTVCPAGEVCAAGQCQASCLAGQLLCGDKCVDPQTDRAFCGATGDCAGANAGTVCPSGEVCAAGQCQASCLAGQLLCGDKCVDPQADRAFCGATGDCAGANAGTVCPSGEVCAAGQCQASCLAGQLLCGDKCVDPLADRALCGATGDCAGANAGTVCVSGEVCAGGDCVTSCLPGLVACDATCIDPQTDREFCGASADCMGATAGMACAPDENCVAGQCKRLPLTYEYTGRVQYFFVPAGVTALKIEAHGAEGGGIMGTQLGGAGAHVTARVPVMPGEMLLIHAGGAGGHYGAPGYNGGGSSGGAGGGGGASDVRRAGAGLADRIVVAAGGGGGITGNGWGVRGGNGGCAAGIAGGNGANSSPVATGGGGATQTAGGTAGLGANNNAADNGQPGQLGAGGAGGPSSRWEGGAGGGGYYGGGGGGGFDGAGSSAGGGGGSSYWRPDSTDASCSAGVRSGNGQVVISIP